MLTFEGALREGTARLMDAGAASAGLDCGLLLSEATGLDRLTIYTHRTRELNAEQYAKFEELLRRREVGEPMAYILGKREFWGRDFAVRRGVLIPRPDTETLIEAFTQKFTDKAAPLRMAEVGVGSGAIIITLLCEYPNATADGSDISPDAHAVTAENAKTHHVAARLTLHNAPWLEAMGEGYDVIVSNPPYIPHHEMETLMRDVRNFEPHLALEAGSDGLDAYRAIIPAAAKKLKKGGVLLLEVGYNQAQAVSALFEQQQQWQQVETCKDLAGISRVVCAQLR